MNRNVLRALAADAFHEVVDNWVFRILAVLTLVPILFTFLVGMGPDSIEILFGAKSWSYAELFGAFGIGALPPDPQGTVIGVVLTGFFEVLAGGLGMLLALSATAFFVPRMLEKGTADLYFHKPVSRTSLLASRYFAGLVFVALVSGILVLGTYLGLLLVSDYAEPGVLVAAPQLVYTFALIHAFSVLCGVVTRSTVAAILLSSFFFLFNGCIHSSWITWEQASRGPGLHVERAEGRADGSQAPAEPEALELDAGESSPALRVVRTILDTLHFVLPKTTDADYFARKVRKALDPPVFRDEDSLVTVFRLESGLERLDEAALGRLDPPAELRAALGEARFAARAADGGLHSLWRRAAKTSETRFGERVRVRQESSSQAADELEEVLVRAGAQALTEQSGRFGSEAGAGELSGSILRWQDGARAPREARVFRGSGREWIYTLLVELPSSASGAGTGSDAARVGTPEGTTAGPSGSENAAETAGDPAAAALLSQLGLDLLSLEGWYPSQLGFTAPLRFNILFSIGSSLAFAAATFALAVWRLRRIAF